MLNAFDSEISKSENEKRRKESERNQRVRSGLETLKYIYDVHASRSEALTKSGFKVEFLEGKIIFTASHGGTVAVEVDQKTGFLLVGGNEVAGMWQNNNARDSAANLVAQRVLGLFGITSG